MKLDKIKDEKGIALLLTLGILMLITILAMAFFSSQHTENKATTNFLYSAKAEEIAESALEHAKIVLKSDKNGWDAKFERWGPLYPDDDGFSIGTDLDKLPMDFDTMSADKKKYYADRYADLAEISADIDDFVYFVNPSATPPYNPLWTKFPQYDSRWIYINDGTRDVGRYAIRITDEPSKADINAFGNLHNTDMGTLNQSNQGWTASEVSLRTILREIDALYKADLGITPSEVKEDYGKDIVEYRYGNDKQPGAAGDDDNDSAILENDNIDNDGDGEIDESGEGRNEPDEFNLGGFWSTNNPASNSFYGDDRPFLSTSQLQAALPGSDTARALRWSRLASFVTVSSISHNIYAEDPFEEDPLDPRVHAEWSDKLLINKDTTVDQLVQLLEKAELSAGGKGGKGNLTETQIYQIAVNIKDFIDPDSEPTKTTVKIMGKDKDIYGIEKTAYINEVEASPMRYLNTRQNYQPTNTLPPPAQRDGFARYTGAYVELIYIYDGTCNLTLYKLVVERNGEEKTLVINFAYKTLDENKRHFVIYDNIGQIWRGGASGTWYRWRDPRALGDVYYDFIRNDNDYDLEPSRGLIGLKFNDKYVEMSNFGNAGMNTKATMEKNDPRVDDWFTSTSGSRGLENTNWNPMAGGEIKSKDERYWRGLCIVRNGLANIGQLSDVHRAGQWRTINFNPDDAEAPGTYLETYAGDLKLLDRVTIRDDGSVASRGSVWLGKININTASKQVLQGFLRGCMGFNDPMAENTAFAMRHPGTKYTCLVHPEERHGAPGKCPQCGRTLVKYVFRSVAEIQALPQIQFLGAFLAKDGVDNDASGVIDDEPAEKELILRNMSNLITVNSNIFKITILAQAFDRRGQVAAEKKLEVIVDRGYISANPNTNDVKILSYRWVTE